MRAKPSWLDVDVDDGSGMPNGTNVVPPSGNTLAESPVNGPGMGRKIVWPPDCVVGKKPGPPAVMKGTTTELVAPSPRVTIESEVSEAGGAVMNVVSPPGRMLGYHTVAYEVDGRGEIVT